MEPWRNLPLYEFNEFPLQNNSWLKSLYTYTLNRIQLFTFAYATKDVDVLRM